MRVSDPSAERPKEAHGSRRALVLLAGGAVVGFSCAVGAALAPTVRSSAPPAGAVATVNGRAISAALYERLLAGLASDRNAAVTPADRRRVLDRMIDEELLVQHALDIDLVRSDARVRADLTDTMMAAAIAQARVGEPSRAELERFFADNAAIFSGVERVRVNRVFVAGAPTRSEQDAERRAREAARRMGAGDPNAAVAAELGDAAPIELPDGALAPGELRTYLGPTAARRCLDLDAGEVTEPLRTASGWQVLQVVARESTRAGTFDDVQDTVRAEWKRRAEERALRDYLDRLRAGASVAVSPAY